VTGANGHLGRGLLRLLGDGSAIRAGVRSERAAAAVRAAAAPLPPQIHLLDYEKPGHLERACEGCRGWVHLVGILKESPSASYEEAHPRTSEAVARAAAKAFVPRIVYLSILGARPGSPNRCLASKGLAEDILLHSGVPTTVLRVPMVLGPGERAAQGLRRQARGPVAFLVDGGRSLEQPIDQRDVLRAIRLALDEPGDESHSLDLAGPECVRHSELVRRVAALLGRSVRILPVPAGLVWTAAGVLERLSPDPPISRDMLGVLLQDDCVDPAPAARQLGLSLTPLAETLRHTFASEGGRAS